MLADIGQVLANFGRSWPALDTIRPEFAEDGPKLGFWNKV